MGVGSPGVARGCKPPNVGAEKTGGHLTSELFLSLLSSLSNSFPVFLNSSLPILQVEFMFLAENSNVRRSWTMAPSVHGRRPKGRPKMWTLERTFCPQDGAEDESRGSWCSHQCLPYSVRTFQHAPSDRRLHKYNLTKAKLSQENINPPSYRWEKQRSRGK